MNICLACNTRTSNPKFCSKSCAAKYNNSLYPKKKRIKRNKCKQCTKEVNRAEKIYCNTICQRKYERILRIKEGKAGQRCIKTYMEKELKIVFCAICKLDSWNNLKITLELDHIDGNSTNNSLDNLRLLCPNCHSQTPTYKSKNRGNGRSFRRERYIKGKSY